MNDDGSYDLFLGQTKSTSGGGTVCRVIEDFVPPRRHQISRSLNVLSSGIGGVGITGTKPGTTPYRAVCTDSESITLTAISPSGYVFKKWEDEKGTSQGTGPLHLNMTEDRTLTAIFEPAPESSRLLISKIHHFPALPSANEATAGYTDRNQFEYLEFINTGSTTLDLTDLQITGAGISFDFTTASIQQLPPGERILIVANNGAYTQRYAAESLQKVTGTFNGNLHDDSGTLTLSENGTVLHTISYENTAPWPKGDDYGLVLINPAQQPQPDLNDGSNWRGSVKKGGTPGFNDAINYENWTIEHENPTLEPDIDNDGDGRPNLIEYLQDTNPALPDGPGGTTGKIETLEVESTSNSYFVIRVLHKVGADDIRISIEKSHDLQTWSQSRTQYIGRERIEGTSMEWLLYRSEYPTSGYNQFFARVLTHLN